MINANLDQFLDYGWFSEATLYYKGFTYWCEGYRIEKDAEKYRYFVYRYRSVIHEDKSGNKYTTRLIKDNDVADFSYVFDVYVDSEEEGKQKFFEAKIFDGKSFWEVEKEIAWYDEYEN